PAVTIVSKEPIQVDGVNEASFHWTSCLFPENGFYDFNTALVADGDGSTVTLANTLTLAIKGLHTYTWGSELAPDTFGTV
ncbi:MAG: hypothetical protein J2P32_18270, partial [Actinobacteria bacterium]|nr:hypothetical protein [Actinomycetota bacterium]